MAFPLTILHTSDWHLGKTLCDRRRYDEFQSLLDWMLEMVERESVDVLLLAGDVFDSCAPGMRAQELYYRFLASVARSRCRHVVVTAGNHDSAALLDAPRDLLRPLNVHVVGAARADPAEEALLLRDEQGEPELVVCAVPYLRERDVRFSGGEESFADKDRRLREGIRAHYQAALDAAERLRNGVAQTVPMVGMGHLFATGGQSVDGERELYVGTLAQVAVEDFAGRFDYLALGHLHTPQQVASSPWMRYSGSPLALSFKEAGQGKSVCLVRFAGAGARPEVTCKPAPCWRHLESVRGDWPALAARLGELRAEEREMWLEIDYDGPLLGDLRERLEALMRGSRLELLRVRDRRRMVQALEQGRPDEELENLGAEEVFLRCLDRNHAPEEEREQLLLAYHEVLEDLAEFGAVNERR